MGAAATIQLADLAFGFVAGSFLLSLGHPTIFAHNIAVPAAVVLRKIATIIDADAHPLPYPYRNIKQKAVFHQDDYKLEVNPRHTQRKLEPLRYVHHMIVFKRVNCQGGVLDHPGLNTLATRCFDLLHVTCISAAPNLTPIFSACWQIMRGGVLVCTVQIYLLGSEQGTASRAQYMVEFLRGQVREHFPLLSESILGACGTDRKMISLFALAGGKRAYFQRVGQLA